MGKSKGRQGFLVEAKIDGKWNYMTKFMPRIVGWRPAVFPKKDTADRYAKKLRKTGIGVGVRNGQVLMKKVPIRTTKVRYSVSGKVGSRVYDIKRIR